VEYSAQVIVSKTINWKLEGPTVEVEKTLASDIVFYVTITLAGGTSERPGLRRQTEAVARIKPHKEKET
jgi:hypothetical protein